MTASTPRDPSSRAPPREEVWVWRSEELAGLELMRATYVTHSFAPHSHDTFVVGAIERGIESFSYRRARVVAPAGSVILVNPGEVHTGESPIAEGWTYCALYPSPELVREAAEQLAGRPVPVPDFRVAVGDDPALVGEVRRLHAAVAGPTSILERRSRLLCTLALLVERYADAGRPIRLGREHTAVRRAREVLDARAAENVTLEQLAEAAGLSMFHLIRVFRRDVGLPPHAYQLQRRVERARALLREGMPAGQAALETGFSDQSHLTRELKRRHGVTPARYAAAVRGAERKSVQERARGGR